MDDSAAGPSSPASDHGGRAGAAVRHLSGLLTDVWLAVDAPDHVGGHWLELCRGSPVSPVFVCVDAMSNQVAGLPDARRLAGTSKDHFRTSLRGMALRPDEFYDHAVGVADAERRLPLARMTGWDISPFDLDGLRVAPLRPPVLPEPARHGEDPSDCDACRDRDKGIWFNDHWRLARITGVGVPLALMLYPRDHYDMADLPDEMAAELGLLSTRIVRHVQALPHISRAHVYRVGDGGAHLHVWFFARPEGQTQLYGSWLVIWDDLLPEYPAALAEADADIVADALVASHGGNRSPVTNTAA